MGYQCLSGQTGGPGRFRPHADAPRKLRALQDSGDLEVMPTRGVTQAALREGP